MRTTIFAAYDLRGTLEPRYFTLDTDSPAMNSDELGTFGITERQGRMPKEIIGVDGIHVLQHIGTVVRLLEGGGYYSMPAEGRIEAERSVIARAAMDAELIPDFMFGLWDFRPGTANGGPNGKQTEDQEHLYIAVVHDLLSDVRSVSASIDLEVQA